MISHLRGTVIYKDLKVIIVDCSGVGYKVTSTIDLLTKADEHKEISAWIYTVVREDVLELYGFVSKKELEFFELLISVSGIGPKSALNILNVASIEALTSAIISGEIAHLTKVSGISKRNAEKIVLELKGKVDGEISNQDGFKENLDAVEALKALGYSQKDAREILKELPSNLTVSEKIKEALKKLS